MPLISLQGNGLPRKECVWPDFMAGVSFRGTGGFRIFQSGGFGADGEGVVCVPAAAVAFSSQGFAFALSLGGAAAGGEALSFEQLGEVVGPGWAGFIIAEDLAASLLNVVS